MKDIKTLYLTAKSSGKQADINAYTEAIQELFENNPNGYISQLEYIIKSDIGFQTFKPFIEKYGLPIACYDDVINTLNECVRKCEIYKKDTSMYIEAIDEFKNFRSEYLNCFMMFENFSHEMKDNYIKTYYGKNKNGYQNRKLVSGMINTFGESAIPDLLITAESMGEATVKTVLEFIVDKYNENCATIYEWVLMACNDIQLNESCNEVISKFQENCLSTIVNKIKNREHQLFRESVIMDRDDLMMEYSEDEINVIQELIMFKEYQMTWVDEFTERRGFRDVGNPERNIEKMFRGSNVNNDRNKSSGISPEAIKKFNNLFDDDFTNNTEKDNYKNIKPKSNITDDEVKDFFDNLFADDYKKESINKLQNEIYNLYEMMDGLIEEDSADLIVDMLGQSKDPESKSIQEALWMSNTHNKKTGKIPGYLGNNHDIHYGEEDPNKNKSNTQSSDSSEKEPSLEDYRRPSATSGSGSVLNLPSAYNDKDEDDNKSTPTSTSNVSEDDKRIINNYYYTYTNSLNRNSNSFNKDNSVRNHHSKDDHSTSNTTITHTGSHNKTDKSYSLIPEDDSDLDKPESESSNPWNLDIFGNDTFLEEVGDADDNKPKSDHPVKDILTDIDKATTKTQQKIKKKVQNTKNVARAAMKPVNRTKLWISKLITDWKDADENNIKEKMTDPHSRKNIYNAIRKAIIAGSFIKAGLLFNPLILFLTVTRGIGKNKREFRIRNEIIGELKAEIEIMETKIQDAASRGDHDAKYKLMRLKNELNKKLIRVGGTKEIRKMI